MRRLAAMINTFGVWLNEGLFINPVLPRPQRQPQTSRSTGWRRDYLSSEQRRLFGDGVKPCHDVSAGSLWDWTHGKGRLHLSAFLPE
jgi:hypothetical protein